MGTPASGNIEILCVDNKSAIKIERLLVGVNDKLSEYYKRESDNDCYLNFYKIERLEDTLYLENDSERIENCEWQIDILLEYLKKNYSDSLLTFSADIMVSDNYIYEEFEGEQNND